MEIKSAVTDLPIYLSTLYRFAQTSTVNVKGFFYDIKTAAVFQFALLALPRLRYEVTLMTELGNICQLVLGERALDRH